MNQTAPITQCMQPELMNALSCMIDLWNNAVSAFPVLANERTFIEAKATLEKAKASNISRLPNDIKIGGDLGGTYLNGYITCSYAELVALFGQPGEGDGYKVDAEWVLTVQGKTMTIYNYKDGKNYLGDEGWDVSEITDWHIGGRGGMAMQIAYVASLLNNAKFKAA